MTLRALDAWVLVAIGDSYQDPDSFVRQWGVEALALFGIHPSPPDDRSPQERAFDAWCDRYERNPPRGSAEYWTQIGQDMIKARRLAEERARIEADLQRVRADHGAGDPIGRASKYLAACESAVSGQGRNPVAWGVVLRIVRGFALEEREAVALLDSEYAPRCQPRLPHAELRGMVRRAMSASKPPWGYLLEQRRDGR